MLQTSFTPQLLGGKCLKKRDGTDLEKVLMWTCLYGFMVHHSLLVTCPPSCVRGLGGRGLFTTLRIPLRTHGTLQTSHCVYVCECVSGPRHEIEGAGVIGIEVTLKLIPEVEVPLDRAWRKGCVINMPGEGALTFIHKRKCLIFSLGKLHFVLARFLCSLNKRQCNFVKTRALVFHLPINYGLEYALIKI